MVFRRRIILNYPARLLPDNLRGEIDAGAIVSIRVDEEPGSEVDRQTIARQTVAERWVAGELVPIDLLEVPSSLLEDPV